MDALGLSRTDLAERCGVDIRTLQRWFSGTMVKRAHADRLAAALLLGTNEVFDGPEEPGLEYSKRILLLAGRLLRSREAAAAQLFSQVVGRFPHVLDSVAFRAHPARGFVYPATPPPAQPPGFAVFRVQPSHGKQRMSIVALLRLAPGVLLERARIAVVDDHASLAETHFVRSSRAPVRADGSFDLWYWAQDRSDALLLVCEQELSVSCAPYESARTLFDLAVPETQHAVCVRPVLSQLFRAGLSRGFDRVQHRDPSRIDFDAPPDH